MFYEIRNLNISYNRKKVMYMFKKEKVESSSKDYEKIIDQQDEKINVLLMGVSGCGKSTLINAILGEEAAKTGQGSSATERMEVYSNDSLPFRLIDTVGYEYSFLKQLKIKNEIMKWSKSAIGKKSTDKLIHVIWFCIDATSKRIDKQVLDFIKSVSLTWKNVPIIVVFTKSYSDAEEKENKEMFEKVKSEYKDSDKLNIKGTCYVVAKSYPINENYVVSEKGLEELVEMTNELAPEAMKINKENIIELDKRLKNNRAYTVIVTSTIGASVIGAVPIPVADAAVLVPLQTLMLNSIAKIYKIKEEDQTNKIIDTIIKVGTTTLVGRGLVKMLGGVNAAMAVINGAVAGAVTFVAGAICNTVFSKVYFGELDINKTDWSEMITKLFDEKMPTIVTSAQKYIDDKNVNEFVENLLKAFGIKKSKEEK